METFDHGLLQHFKGPGAVANDLTCIKYTLVKYLFISVESEYTGAVGVATGNNLKDASGMKVGTM